MYPYPEQRCSWFLTRSVSYWQYYCSYQKPSFIPKRMDPHQVVHPCSFVVVCRMTIMDAHVKSKLPDSLLVTNGHHLIPLAREQGHCAKISSGAASVQIFTLADPATVCIRCTSALTRFGRRATNLSLICWQLQWELAVPFFSAQHPEPPILQPLLFDDQLCLWSQSFFGLRPIHFPSFCFVMWVAI